MYLIWLLLFASNPPLMLLGISGFFGEEAQEAAGDMAVVYGILAVVLLVVIVVVGVISAIAKIFS